MQKSTRIPHSFKIDFILFKIGSLEQKQIKQKHQGVNNIFSRFFCLSITDLPLFPLFLLICRRITQRITEIWSYSLKAAQIQ